MWKHLATRDIKAKYRGTILGFLWFIVQTSLMFVGVSILWSAIFDAPFLSYFGFIGIGIATWGLISNSVGESTIVLLANSSMFLNSKTNLIVGCMRRIWANCIIFAAACLIPFITSIFVYKPTVLELLSSMIGLILIILNAIVWCALLSLLGAKYRDLQPAVATMLQAMWIASPILYKPSLIADSWASLFLDLNPFAWLIIAFRDPLLGEEVSSNYYFFSLILLIVGTILANKAFRKGGRKYATYI